MRLTQLHQAIYDGLNVSGVTSLLSAGHSGTPIYTQSAPQVSDNASASLFPYITVSFIADDVFTDKDQAGHEALVQVDIWHRTSSELALKAIAQAAFDALHRVALPGLTGHITTECENMEFSTDDDGITRRAMAEFRVISLG